MKNISEGDVKNFELCSKLSLYSYSDEKDFKKLVKKAFPKKFSKIKFFTKEGTQCYYLETKHNIMFVFRGTEFKDKRDLKVITNIGLRPTSYSKGKIVRGFINYTERVISEFRDLINENEKPIIITGHSLGAAAAIILTYYIKNILRKKENIKVVTFGCPRLGNRKFTKDIWGTEFYRLVNNTDWVARTPTVLLGYYHNSKPIYFNDEGRIVKYNFYKRILDIINTTIEKFFKKGKIDPYKDHLIRNYISIIENLNKNISD